jgi:hypothetical protein
LMTTGNNDYDYGYIYCISNASMPDILNIGITWMTPEQKMEDINGLSRLWRPPTPYKCEFAKRVLDAEQKRNAIYKVLSASRINPPQRFFSVSIEEVRTLFDLMDGEYWTVSAATAAAAAAGDIYDIPANVDTQVYCMLEKKEKEIKGIEEKMLECLFQKCDEIEMEMENKRAELSELNAVIEERKAALKDLRINIPPPSSSIEAEQIITEY